MHILPIDHPRAADLVAHRFLSRLQEELGPLAMQIIAAENARPNRDPDADCYSRVYTNEDSCCWYADIFDEMFGAGWPEDDEARDRRADLYQNGWDRALDLGLRAPTAQAPLVADTAGWVDVTEHMDSCPTLRTPGGWWVHFNLLNRGEDWDGPPTLYTVATPDYSRTFDADDWQAVLQFLSENPVA